MKKAQIEMVGLLIIVILIVLVLFFVLSFSLSDPGNTEPKVQEFVDDSILDGFLLVLMETSSTCGNYNFKQLLEDNATQVNLITCGNNNGGFVSSGEFAKENLEKLINRSMNFIGMDYDFTATFGNTEFMKIEKNGCENARNIQTDRASFTTRQGYTSVHLRLEACWG